MKTTDWLGLMAGAIFGLGVVSLIRGGVTLTGLIVMLLGLALLGMALDVARTPRREADR